ncbi:F420-dependent NADP oxidoreductase [Flavobacterium sp. NRK F10]|uniref:Rossmann-like and DUF2520 domain-containing protein n=1 Tax=Flavobacterium sp. NRK F10 TaxID=2954931 RepID=UPI002090F900|nr:Rossmann-like and DUF2520 domain-containing protein [Flavobacterium sp. NRK F10]MCO6173463.1 F420-dependent NADP oxidoreductase [Flavobacterium sp. NRK F10]
MITVSVIGSGNVAQHLIKVFSKTTGIELVQAFARQPESLLHLLPYEKITNDYQKLQKADVYIISVTDNAIAEVSEQLPFKDQLVVHTSGTSAISILDSKNRKGVFYPLQTFSKNKEINFSSVPLCLETEDETDFQVLEKVAQAISEKVYRISSEQRRSLHVAAVFVCNFVNHLYYIGNEVCDKNNVPFEVLHPLIRETAQKIMELSPEEAQTGPAKRNDTKTINQHIEFLKDSKYQDIYKLLTQSIQDVSKKL